MLRLLATLLVVALAAWLLAGEGGRRSGAWRMSGLVALIVAGVLTWPLLSGALAGGVSGNGEARVIGNAAARAARSEGPWEPWSVQRVESLTGSGNAVFVDFTAAWCVTCQVNKQLVLSRDSVLAAFRDKRVALLRADWTRQNPEITRALQALGRNGVPAYALYRPGKDPLLLPELLSEASVREALAML
jgi:thiol:disulfide interchange protein DsbD